LPGKFDERDITSAIETEVEMLICTHVSYFICFWRSLIHNVLFYVTRPT